MTGGLSLRRTAHRRFPSCRSPSVFSSKRIRQKRIRIRDIAVSGCLSQKGSSPEISVAKSESILLRNLVGQHHIKFVPNVSIRGTSGHACHWCPVVRIESVCGLSEPVRVIVIGDFEIRPKTLFDTGPKVVHVSPANDVCSSILAVVGGEKVIERFVLTVLR